MALAIHLDIEAFRHHFLGSLLQRFTLAMLRTGTIAPLAIALDQQGGVVRVGLELLKRGERASGQLRAVFS